MLIIVNNLQHHINTDDYKTQQGKHLDECKIHGHTLCSCMILFISQCLTLITCFIPNFKTWIILYITHIHVIKSLFSLKKTNHIPADSSFRFFQVSCFLNVTFFFFFLLSPVSLLYSPLFYSLEYCYLRKICIFIIRTLLRFLSFSHWIGPLEVFLGNYGIFVCAL